MLLVLFLNPKQTLLGKSISGTSVTQNLFTGRASVRGMFGQRCAPCSIIMSRSPGNTDRKYLAAINAQHNCVNLPQLTLHIVMRRKILEHVSSCPSSIAHELFYLNFPNQALITTPLVTTVDIFISISSPL